MLMLDNWGKIKQRFDALWQGEIIDRCCASVVSWKSSSLAHLPETGDNPDFSDPADVNDYWKNPDRVLKRSLQYIDMCHYAGEAFPVICHYFAPAGHAEFFGGSPHYENGTVWYDPTITDLEKQFPKFDNNSRALQEQLDIYQYLVRNSHGRFLVSMPDHVGAADALSHLMGPEALMMEIIDRPQLVQAAINEINIGWREVSERFYQVVKDDAGGSTVGWLGTWARGRHAQMQCDLSVMLSSDDFARLLLPELAFQMKWIEFPLYHLDGMAQLRHLDLLLELPELKMIQWTNVVGQPPASAFIREFKRMQKAGKCLLLSVSPDEIEVVLRELSAKGLFLSVGAENEQEAEQIIKLIEKNTHE